MDWYGEQVSMENLTTGSTLTGQEVCAALGVAPSTFRSILDEFSPALAIRRKSGRFLVPQEDMAKLKRILHLRNLGLDVSEILTVIAKLEQEDSISQSPLHLDQAEEENVAIKDLAEKLENLVMGIGRQEEKRLEERDRILTTLVRTRQEIQGLRRDLAAAIPRRRRRGLLERIFGA